MAIKHQYVSTKPDQRDDTDVRPSDWNADHVVELEYITKTTDYTITSTDEVILVDASSGNITITLPALSSVDKQVVRIKKISGGGIVTITPNGSDTIDNDSTKQISVTYTTLTLLADNTNSNWWII